MVDEKQLRERYQLAGQQHVLKFIDNLSGHERESLLKQLDNIKVEEIRPMVESALKHDMSTGDGGKSTIQPFLGRVGRSTDSILVEKSRSKGMEIIGRGQVAALVLAGGQGTRLGYSGPKGMFDVGLPSGSTLFQLISERIKRISQLAHTTMEESDHQQQLVPFYIMTSPLNHDETVSYFRNHDYFGLGERNVFFFQQGMLPCVTDGDYQIIMESTGAVAMAPDGNGGIYPSLNSSGALEEMKKRGVRYLHVFSIDNALVKPADPVFIGYCVNENADCGNKVVWKAHAHEAVGVVASKEGKPCIVEYSEITKEMAERTDDNGELLFGAGNVCNHFYTIDFIESTILPNMGALYHVARKKIPYYNEETKETVSPTENNGIKLETFIFDVFPFSQRMAVLDVRRSEEFAPVKNKAGSDSPATARAMISELSMKYLIDVGAQIVGDEIKGSTCEISPLVTYAGEGLEEFNGRVLSAPFKI